MSLSRSFICNISDDEIFDYFINKNYKLSELYIKAIEIIDEIDVIHGVTAHACPFGLEYDHDQQLDE